MDLVRKILLAVEDSPFGLMGQQMPVVGYDWDTIGYHHWLIVSADLANGSETTCSGSNAPNAIITSLTWKGHEFIEAARDESRWTKAKKLIQEKSGAMTIEIVSGVLMSIAKSAVGL